MPTGTLTKKIHGQENDCVSTPPRIRPTAEPPIAIAAQTPSALARSLPSANVVEMIDSAAGEISAAPSPCSAREPISIPSLTASPSSSEAEVKMTRPTRKSRLRPSRSPSAAAEQQEAAEHERVAVDHPLEVGLAEVEILLDRRQGDVDDRRVEDDHELREADEDEDDPGVRGVAHRSPIKSGRQSPLTLANRAAVGALASRLALVESSLPVADRPRRPDWIKVRAPSEDSRYFDVKKLIHGASLHTICEEARCPNISECWGRGTATFQILGETCTRACRYCYVHSGKPSEPVDPLEPLRLAQAASQMELKHVVVTSVDRDDVPDRGAGHYAATIRALKAKLPDCSVEVLTPDFLGVEEEALQTVLAARPEVFNHNIETVRRLHRAMRGGKADYDRALWLLQRAKEIADYPVLTKSGIIVGLGETNDEIVETLRDLRAHGVDVVTIGQYLQPSPKHAQIDRWVHPDEFRWLREQGEALGFGSVFAGPLVRSSYRADEQRHAAESGRGAVAY